MNGKGVIKVKTATKMLSFSLGTVLLLSMFAGCNKGPDDATITQNVQAKLKADPVLATTGINVSTAVGVVALTGTVMSAADKARAEQLAAGVAGVKSVVNNLFVKPAVVIAPDDPLKTAVNASLVKYGITGITVTVANGEVTLTGDIPRAKLQDAMKAANEAHPKKVNNQMTIK